MAQVNVYLLEDARFGEVYGSRPLDKALALIDQGAYKKKASFDLAVNGEAAAEELFDLSNNPGRDAERFRRWGRNRSLSVGDLVQTEGETYLCAPVGWVALPPHVTLGDAAKTALDGGGPAVDPSANAPTGALDALKAVAGHEAEPQASVRP